MRFFGKKKTPPPAARAASPVEVDDSYVMADSLPEKPTFSMRSLISKGSMMSKGDKSTRSTRTAGTSATEACDGVMKEETPTTQVPLAPSHEDAAAAAMAARKSSSHLCFGRFCDMRSGTVSLNLLNIFVRILALGFSFAWGMVYPFSTDLVSIAMSAIAICGAINYLYCFTGVASIGLMGVAVYHMIYQVDSFGGILFDLLLVYPTSVITYEIMSGVMSRDNYEEYIDPEIRVDFTGGVIAVKENINALDIESQISRRINEFRGGDAAANQEQHASESDEKHETDYVNIENDGEAIPPAESDKPTGSLA